MPKLTAARRLRNVWGGIPPRAALQSADSELQLDAAAVALDEVLHRPSFIRSKSSWKGYFIGRITEIREGDFEILSRAAKLHATKR